MDGEDRVGATDILEVQVVTEKRAYEAGEPIALRASYRNRGEESFVIGVCGNNLLEVADGLSARQRALLPLYSMERLVLTAEPGTGGASRVEIRPVRSNLFVIGRLLVLQAGEQYDEGAMLSTGFWEPVEAAVSPFYPAGYRELIDGIPQPPRFPPGRYRLEAIYSRAALRPYDLERMRRFVPSDDVDRDLDEFWRMGVEVSYRQMEIYRSCDFRAWTGRIQTPAWELVVE